MHCIAIRLCGTQVLRDPINHQRSHSANIAFVSVYIARLGDLNSSTVLADAQNVVVPESGEDSEDEWNYINVKHADTKRDVALSLIAHPNDEDASSAIVEDEAGDVVQNKTIGQQTHIVAPIVEELHAVLQALVEPQEEFAEVSVAYSD